MRQPSGKLLDKTGDLEKLSVMSLFTLIQKSAYQSIDLFPHGLSFQFLNICSLRNSRDNWGPRLLT